MAGTGAMPQLGWLLFLVVSVATSVDPGPGLASGLAEAPRWPDAPLTPPMSPPPVVPAFSPLVGGRFLDARDPGDEGQCARDAAAVEQAASNRTMWAVRMLDASAHEPTGVLFGMRYQLGNFDACMSAGKVSPVGARYCLVGVSHSGLQRPGSSSSSSVSSGRPWEVVWDLPPHQDVADVLSGEGMAPGSLPLGDVRMALCVPRSCTPPALQRALQASLGDAKDTVRVTVRPEYCREYAAVAPSPSTPAKLFWGLLAALTAVAIAAPALGWTSWDWRRHLRALGLPDPVVNGLDLSPLSGIRTFNAIYLVGLHRGVHAGRVAIANHDLYTNQTRRELGVLYRGALAVDSFFFLAGLLLGVSSLSRRGEPFWKSLANRLVRVVPVYALVVLWHCTAMPEMGTGPMWAEVAEPMSSACKRWWWSNLLFLNNYAHGGTEEPVCMEHSWSLAVDMHMFVVGSLLSGLLPSGAAGLGALAGLAVLSTVPVSLGTLLGRWPGAVPFTLRLMQGMWAEPLFHAAYTPTHMRATPYLVGMLVGRAMPLLRERGFRPGHAASLLATLGGVLGLVAVMTVTASFNDLRGPYSPLSAVLCACLTPLTWSAALALIAGGLVLGERTVVRSFLSWQPLVTLSRLTFAVYLVSYPLQALVTAAARHSVYLDPAIVLSSSLSDSVISFAISFWIFVVLEAPLRTMAKKILSANKSAAADGDADKKPPVSKTLKED